MKTIYPFGDARPAFVIALVFAVGLLFASVAPEIIHTLWGQQ